MKITVVGFDPSMTNWGITKGVWDSTTGILENPTFTLIEPRHMKGKQVRVNSNDLYIAEQLFNGAYSVIKDAKVIFAEVPVGSQNSRGAIAIGMCVGILAAFRALGHQVVEVTAEDVKLALSGDPNASKKQMVQRAMALYPEAQAQFPRNQKGEVSLKAEHLADSLGTIHAGVNTPLFLNLMQLLRE